MYHEITGHFHGKQFYSCNHGNTIFFRNYNHIFYSINHTNLCTKFHKNRWYAVYQKCWCLPRICVKLLFLDCFDLVSCVLDVYSPRKNSPLYTIMDTHAFLMKSLEEFFLCPFLKSLYLQKKHIDLSIFLYISQ